MRLKVALLLLLPLIASSQQVEVLRSQKLPLLEKLNFSLLSDDDYEQKVIHLGEQPKPASDYGDKKQLLHEKRMSESKSSATKASRSVVPKPIVLTGFIANTAQGVPNDNHVAASGNRVVSVVNTNVRMYDTAGTQVFSRSLANFANSLGILLNISDPRVLYDPTNDRYILMFFSGTQSLTSSIIVAFSETNNPTGNWNFYSLNGNYRNDTTWSDYPIVTLSDKDLFMTFNHLKDGEGWQTGFRYSAIWQVDLAKGYAGDTLEFNYWHSFNFKGENLWSVCPAQGGLQPSGPESYFISLRPSALENDTVFLHTITNSVASGSAQYSLKVLKAPLSYGLPPNAVQGNGEYLATNDARALDAKIENNKLIFVGNSIADVNNNAAIYVGVIDNPGAANPSVRATIISNDSIEYGYPSLAYVGDGPQDNRYIITASYVTQNSFPGTAAIYFNHHEEYSEPAIVKAGETWVNVLQDTVERWGDYTGIQRAYDERHTVWISGAYGRQNQHRTWVAKVKTSDTLFVASSVDVARQSAAALLYPNPAEDFVTLEFESEAGNETRIALYDINGRLVKTLMQDRFRSGKNLLKFSTAPLPKGTYTLTISDRSRVVASKQLVVQ